MCGTRGMTWRAQRDLKRADEAPRPRFLARGQVQSLGA